MVFFPECKGTIFPLRPQYCKKPGLFRGRATLFMSLGIITLQGIPSRCLRSGLQSMGWPPAWIHIHTKGAEKSKSYNKKCIFAVMKRHSHILWALALTLSLSLCYTMAAGQVRLLEEEGEEGKGGLPEYSFPSESPSSQVGYSRYPSSIVLESVYMGFDSKESILEGMHFGVDADFMRRVGENSFRGWRIGCLSNYYYDDIIISAGPSYLRFLPITDALGFYAHLSANASINILSGETGLQGKVHVGIMLDDFMFGIGYGAYGRVNLLTRSSDRGLPNLSFIPSISIAFFY